VATQYDSAPCKLTISSHLFARWHLFQHVGYLGHQQLVDLLTLKVVSESRATWATSVPILGFLGLCSRVSSDVRDRQTDRRQTKASLSASALWRRRHNNRMSSLLLYVADAGAANSSTSLFNDTCVGAHSTRATGNCLGSPCGLQGCTRSVSWPDVVQGD